MSVRKMSDFGHILLLGTVVVCLADCLFGIASFIVLSVLHNPLDDGCSGHLIGALHLPAASTSVKLHPAIKPTALDKPALDKPASNALLLQGQKGRSTLAVLNCSDDETKDCTPAHSLSHHVMQFGGRACQQVEIMV